ncbi:MAG: HAD family phosphatase [Oscillospiraceae bacterium]|nr:HAD family phosphatase [Oscillospiraceae bacterium]
MALEFYHPEWGASRPIFGVLFDMDGLVLDSEVLYTRFWREAAHFYGYPMTAEQSLGMRSLGKTRGQPYLESLFGPGVDYTTLRNKRVELMEAYAAVHGIAPKPGIYELLDFLNEHHIPAAITSSSPMDSIRKHLEKVNLLHRFTALCSGHDIPNGKPAPDIYLLGAERLGLAPENCLALEDSPTGILSAYRAGCLPVMIPDLDQPGEETKKLLYAKADSLTDVVSLIKQQNRHQ